MYIVAHSLRQAKSDHVIATPATLGEAERIAEENHANVFEMLDNGSIELTYVHA